MELFANASISLFQSMNDSQIISKILPTMKSSFKQFLVSETKTLKGNYFDSSAQIFKIKSEFFYQF